MQEMIDRSASTLHRLPGGIAIDRARRPCVVLAWIDGQPYALQRYHAELLGTEIAIDGCSRAIIVAVLEDWAVKSIGMAGIDV